MTRPRAGAIFVAAGALLVGCAQAGAPNASPVEPADDPIEVKVTLTNEGCAPDRPSAPAGALLFSIVNEGGDAVSEVELMQGERILGEKENLVPGLSGSFTLVLEPGSYRIYCPGATTSEAEFEVTPASESGHLRQRRPGSSVG